MHSTTQNPPARSIIVTLADGSQRDIAGMNQKQLEQIHWEQERAWAIQIKNSRPGEERSRITGAAYDCVATIYSHNRDPEGGAVSLGMTDRSHKFLRQILEKRRGVGGAGVASPTLFEIGYGSGGLIHAISQHGFDVAGIEVSKYLADQAKARIAPKYHAHLHLGDFLTHPLDGPNSAYDVVWWNDVMEHIPVDQAAAFLRRAWTLLKPGGAFITLTPNWHVRPSDVTRWFNPPRTEAVGFHLKEYKLREVRRMLLDAGFKRVTMPLIVSRKTVVLAGSGLCGVKAFFEPTLEWLPFPVAKTLCGGLGLNCTIGWK